MLTLRIQSISIRFLLLLGILFLLSSAGIQPVSAQVKEFVYESINVEMDVFEDSTVEITEEITHRFKGTFRGVFREITLVDRENLDLCKSNPSLQCGGFEYIEILSVLDNDGRTLNPSEYSVEEVRSGGEDRLRLTWVFSDSGISFNNEPFSYTLKYKVYGSLGYFPDYDLLYWNAIFPDREEIVEDVSVRINFPGDIKFREENLEVIGKGFDYDSKFLPQFKSLIITSDDLLPFEDFTVLLKIPKGLIKEPATLRLDLQPEVQDVVVNGVELKQLTGKIGGIPPGDVELLFSASRYESKEVKLSLAPGEVRDLEVHLKMSLGTILLFAFIIICNALGCLILPLFLFWIYREWSTKGKDIGRRKTIIPYYSPPEKIRPYLLGSIKDETVDLVDITATLIDVAFRGYIKIREFEAKTVLGIKLTETEYEFIKLKEFTDLTPVEQKILTGIFGSKERVTTSALKNSFYKKIPGIQKAIYAEMVSRGYFPKRPDQVRSDYRIKAIIVIVIGFILGFSLVFILAFITSAASILIAGIILLIVAQYMPAKTKKGSKIFEEILGFRMYMHTAERFRIQDLTPETFEKYLSYAMVFGIEKEWGERFKDIYKKPPDWYESSSYDPNVWSTIYLVNALSSFNNATTRTLASSPSSSGSGWSGGGWNGGGGFSGGFSGGGGGGGGGGAF